MDPHSKSIFGSETRVSCLLSLSATELPSPTLGSCHQEALKDTRWPIMQANRAGYHDSQQVTHGLGHAVYECAGTRHRIRCIVNRKWRTWRIRQWLTCKLRCHGCLHAQSSASMSGGGSGSWVVCFPNAHTPKRGSRLWGWGECLWQVATHTQLSPADRTNSRSGCNHGVFDKNRAHTTGHTLERRVSTF